MKQPSFGSQDRISAATGMWLSGSTLKEIGDRFGVSAATVMKHLNRSGVNTTRRGAKTAALARSLDSFRRQYTGKQFGKLTVVLVYRDSGIHAMCKCSCDGSLHPVIIGNLTSGNTQSCGCHKSKMTADRNRVEAGRDTSREPEYKSYYGAKTRCFNQNSPKFREYGARGITMCQRWATSYLNFYEDMGPRPSQSHSLERIDNNANYSCGKCEHCHQHGWGENCRWATPAEQGRNTRNAFRITFRGKTQCLTDWASELGIRYPVLQGRLVQYGWSVEKAFTTPVRAKGTGEYRSLLKQTKGIWRGMIARCHRPTCAGYQWYGARGITVCSRWRDSFASFIEDMGERPSEQHSIDRIDVNRGYNPINCRWATVGVQANNQRAKSRVNRSERVRS